MKLRRHIWPLRISSSLKGLFWAPYGVREPHNRCWRRNRLFWSLTYATAGDTIIFIGLHFTMRWGETSFVFKSGDDERKNSHLGKDTCISERPTRHVAIHEWPFAFIGTEHAPKSGMFALRSIYNWYDLSFLFVPYNASFNAQTIYLISWPKDAFHMNECFQWRMEFLGSVLFRICWTRAFVEKQNISLGHPMKCETASPWREYFLLREIGSTSLETVFAFITG